MRGLLLSFVTLFMLAPPAQAQQLQALMVEKLERYYQIANPTPTQQGDKAERSPLLIVLPDSTQTAKQIWRMKSLIDPALGAGFIVTVPESLDRLWNDGRSITPSGQPADGAHDVLFIKSLIAELVKRENADPKRVYIAGAGNGGLMALRLACEITPQLAGVATLGATMPRPLEQPCKPAKPLSMLMLNGTEDPLMHWDGTAIKGRTGMTLPRMSAPQSIEFWARNNGCIKPEVTVLPDVNETDGSRAKLARYTGCTAPTQFYALDGAGHSWPGQPGSSTQGATNMDIDASAIIIDFFNPPPKG